MTFNIPSSPGAGPSYTSPSPIRSSPLSNPPFYSPSRSPSPSLKYATPRPIPSITSRSISNPHRSSLSMNPSSPPPPATPSPPLSRSHPLLGSYPLSLLHSRMSHAHAPHSVPSDSTSAFALHLSAIGKGKSCPPNLRCPDSLIIPFDATYYDLEDSSMTSCSGRGGGASQTPWVGAIDLEHHFFDRYASRRRSSAPIGTSHTPTTVKPPDHPGYQVAPVGQLQILVRTTKQAVKVFLVPYDLRTLPVGGRLLTRERTYAMSGEPLSQVGAESVTPPLGRPKEALRYAVQLQFVCTEGLSEPSKTQSLGSATTRRRSSHSAAAPVLPVVDALGSPSDSTPSLDGKAFYVSKSIKVVFTSAAPEKDEVLRLERTDETVLPSEQATGAKSRLMGFSPGSLGKRTEDWEMVRRKWFARREMEESQRREMDESQHIPDIEEKGFEMGSSPSIPVDIRSTTPTRATSPLPVLSPFPTIHTALHVHPTSSTANPTKEGFDMPRAASPRPQSIRTPPPNRYSRQKLRRGSGSREERELSERLRLMAITGEEQ